MTVLPISPDFMSVDLQGKRERNEDAYLVDPETGIVSLTLEGFMLSGVPNAAMCVGYTNASWTLKADLVAEVTPVVAGEAPNARFTFEDCTTILPPVTFTLLLTE